MQDASIIIVGNKTDLANREVSRADAEALAKQLNCMYAECSAKTGEGVSQVFETLAKAKLRAVDDKMKLDDGKKKSSGCC